VLDLEQVDLGELAAALEDQSAEHSWWIDPGSGEIVLWSEYSEDEDEPHPDDRGLRLIEPIPSHEAYGVMEEFVEKVSDPRARDLLERAITGRGAFRRFKDTLFEFPALREDWFRLHDAQLERRALLWLVGEGLVEEALVEERLVALSSAEPADRGPVSPPRLYWRPGTASMAPHAALAEIGVDYELVRIERDEAQTDGAYLALNPLGVVPTLVEGDLVVTESAAILLWLADRYPQARLAPEDRAEFYSWLVFMTNTLQTALLRVIYPERYGSGEEVRSLAAAEAAGHFDLIERALDGRAWLVGEERSAADLFLFMLTRWARRLDPPAWNRPPIRSHFLRTLALPGVRRMVAEQALELPDWAA